MHIRQVTIRPYYARVYLKSLVYTIAITANRPCLSSVVLLSSHTNGTLASPSSAVRRIAWASLASHQRRLRVASVASAFPARRVASLGCTYHARRIASTSFRRYRRFRRFRRSSYGASHQRPSIASVVSHWSFPRLQHTCCSDTLPYVIEGLVNASACAINGSLWARRHARRRAPCIRVVVLLASLAKFCVRPLSTHANVTRRQHSPLPY